jgi:acetyl-CoA C-acetyltransferase
MTINNVFIVSAVRTPVGRYMGSLKTVAAYDLAALADILLIQKK